MVDKQRHFGEAELMTATIARKGAFVSDDLR